METFKFILLCALLINLLITIKLSAITESCKSSGYNKAHKIALKRTLFHAFLGIVLALITFII